MVTAPFALLFPGQGAQFVGMGKELAQDFPAAKAVFEEADQLLEFSISRLAWEGPLDLLTRTENCQPALYVTSLAVLAALKAELDQKQFPFQPTAAAGLSLGEYTALTAAGGVSFADGLKLVRLRGQAMEEAANAQPGTMASVLGLELDSLEEICAQTGAQVANINSPGQIVISGSPETVQAASRLAKEKGAKRAVGLEVGGAFHSRLMEPAAARLKDLLTSVEFKAPDMAVVSNVTGDLHPDPETTRTLLVDQLTHPVRWQDGMQTLLKMGIRSFLEVGPGSVLKGLLRKIDSSAQVLSVGTADQVREVAQ